MFDAVPETWAQRTLGDLCDIAIGGTPSRSVPEYWSNAAEGFPWASIADLRSPRVAQTKEFISRAGIENSNAKLVPEGTVLMSFKLSIGRTALAARDLYTNEAIAAFRPNSELDNGFLYYWLPHIVRTAETDQAVKGVTLNKQKLLSLGGPLPSLDEQRRITGVLSSIDALTEGQIAVRDQLAATFDQVVEAAFSEPAWPRVPLGSACRSIQVGIVIRPASYYVETGGVPALRSLNVGENQLYLDDLVYISDEGHRLNSKSSLRPGDVVTRRTGEPGKSAVIPDTFLAGLNCIDIIFSRPNDELRSAFLSFFMNSATAKRQVAAMQGGLAQQHLNVAEMKKLVVPLPLLQRQDEIVEVLDAMWSHLLVEAEAVDRLSTLRAAVAGDLLSGRVRVLA